MIKNYTAYFDGASKGNPGPAGIGGVILQGENVRAEVKKFIGTATNNQAEYSALIEVLRKAKELGAEAISIFSDSELVVRQLNGRYRIKEPKLKILYDQVMALRPQFLEISFNHVPREKNKLADALANQAVEEARQNGGQPKLSSDNKRVQSQKEIKFFEAEIQPVKREKAEVMILGLPLQGKVNSRPGSIHGPQAIRQGSFCIETYSPFLEKDLTSLRFYDDGDIVVKGEGEAALEALSAKISERLPQGVRPVFFGGDHSVSYAAIKALAGRGEKFSVVHLDAHPDSQESFGGESWCYATVMRRARPLVSEIYQLGIRTGTQEELKYARKANKLFLVDRFVEGLAYVEGHAGGENVYVSFDIDAVDPSLAPGTSNPVSGGLLYDQIQLLLNSLRKCKVIGFDLVEVAPNLDPSGLTQIVAAEIVRDAMLAWWA